MNGLYKFRNLGLLLLHRKVSALTCLSQMSGASDIVEGRTFWALVLLDNGYSVIHYSHTTSLTDHSLATTNVSRVIAHQSASATCIQTRLSLVQGCTTYHFSSGKVDQTQMHFMPMFSISISSFEVLCCLFDALRSTHVCKCSVRQGLNLSKKL